MKVRTALIALLILFLLPLASAQWIQPLDCNALFYGKQIVSKTEFTNPESICFYGSDYTDESVNVILDGITDYNLPVQISNGILTTLSGDKKFNDVSPGLYILKVQLSGKTIEYPLEIKVNKDPVNPIPEFSAITAVIVIAIAGLYIYRRRD